MTLNEFNKLQTMGISECLLSVDDVLDPHATDSIYHGMTIFFGFDLDRTTVHIYFDEINREIVVFRYRGGYFNTGEIVSIDRVQHLNQAHLPTKRVYPHASNFRCAQTVQLRMLQNYGRGINFLPYSTEFVTGFTVERFRQMVKCDD